MSTGGRRPGRGLAARVAAGRAMITGTGAGASLVLALLVAASTCYCVAAPRMSLQLRTSALRQLIGRQTPLARSVTGSIDLASYQEGLARPGGGLAVSAGQVATSAAQIARQLARSHVPLARKAAWFGLSGPFTVVSSGAARRAWNGVIPPRIELLDRPALGTRARLIAGRMPSRASGRRGAARFEVAVTRATAVRFGLRPGSALTLRTTTAQGTGLNLRLVVSGILAPADPASAFWTADPNAAAASWNPPSATAPGYWAAAAFVPDPEFTAAERILGLTGMRVTWDFPLALGGVTAGQAPGLSGDLTGGPLAAGVLTAGLTTVVTVPLTCGLAGPLAGFVRTDGQIGSLLSLLYVSLALVAGVALLLGARLLAERRAAEFGLMLARGATSGRIALLALRAAIACVLPAAVAGGVAGLLLTPGAGAPAAWELAGLVTMAALAGLPSLAAWRARRARQAWPEGERDDRPPSRAGRARRVVAEAGLVTAAVAGLVVLRRQGPPPAGGTDWYTSAAPVLVAVPVAVLAARAYPLAVRWLVRLASRGRAVTAFVGLARAARTSPASTLPAFALVLVLSVVAFGAMVRSSVITGDVARSWREAGADAVVDASASDLPVTAATLRAIATVPGVRLVTALGRESALASDGSSLAVITADPASYAALLRDTPAPASLAAELGRLRAAGGAGGAALPALVSPGAAGIVRRGPLLIASRLVRVHVAGSLARVPGVPGQGPFIVLPYRAAGSALGVSAVSPDIVLAVGPGIAQARFAALTSRLLPGATVTFRSRLLSALTQAELPHGAFVMFAVGVGAAAGFGAVIVAIMLALGARPRELTLARLATMGLSPGQARRLVAAEALPWIVAATAGGVACARALVPLVGPAVSLSPLTGSAAPVPVRPDLGLIGALAGAMVALALGALAAQSALTRLRGAAGLLRAGE